MNFKTVSAEFKLTNSDKNVILNRTQKNINRSSANEFNKEKNK